MPIMDSGEANVPMLQNLTDLILTGDMPERALRDTERVFEALRVRLSVILGASGYGMLLSRSIALTRREHTFLATVVADKSGSLVGRISIANEENRVAMQNAFAAVLTRFVTLLKLFIGAGLSERLLEAVWQDLQDEVPYDTNGVGI